MTSLTFIPRTSLSVTSPLAGEGQGGGAPTHRTGVLHTGESPNVTGPSTPTPVPSPQGGGRPDCDIGVSP